MLAQRLVRHERIVDQQLQLEPGKFLRDEPADVAEADQTQGLAGDLRREVGIAEFLPPVLVHQGVVGTGDVARLGDQQPDGEVRYRMSVAPHHVVHHDPALRRGLDIDVLLPGPGRAHETQGRQRVHGARGYRREKRQ